MVQADIPAAPAHRRRMALIIAGLGVHLGLAVLVNTTWRDAVVLNHFAYVPLVLAAVWFGRRAAWLALIPGLAPLALSAANLSPSPPWTDAVRALFYLAVTFMAGLLADRSRAHEAAASRGERNLRNIIESSLAGVAVYRDQRLRFINGRLIAMLGDPQEVTASPDAVDTTDSPYLGRSIWEFVHPDDRAHIEELVARRERDPSGGLRYEARLVAANGRTIHADIASYAIEFQGLPSVLVSVYDVTRLREVEARRRELSAMAREQADLLVHSSRLAEMGEMAAAVAHELNQPLTGIRNYARNATYMLEEDAGSLDEVKENLVRISQQVDRAARIIAQMRALARRSETERVPVQVNAVVRETLEFLDSQMRLAGVEVRRELDESLPLVLGDRLRLWQVFLNIVVNARQAMEDATERVLTVTTHHLPDQELPVVVTFLDTGKGFDPEHAEKLFQPFFTTKGPGRGTGLGLSISHTILQEHQGRIEASCAPGQGACFTVRLPAAGVQEYPDCAIRAATRETREANDGPG